MSASVQQLRLIVYLNIIFLIENDLFIPYLSCLITYINENIFMSVEHFGYFASFIYKQILRSFSTKRLYQNDIDI